MTTTEETALDAPETAAPPRRVVLVTGMSGAGKTTALKALEDAGFEAIDNLPLRMVRGLVSAMEDAGRALAIGIDVRTRDFGSHQLLAEIDGLMDELGVPVFVVFLDCDDEAIERRYTETRRRHPLAEDRAPLDGIRYERRLLAPLRERADLLIDTTLLNVHDLRRLLQGQFRLQRGAGMHVFVTSFSYRRGLPREADLVFDVRFLQNPHYEIALRDRTGQDPDVAAFVSADRGFAPFLDNLVGLLDVLLPRYESEGKSYLTIAFGCTGGKHRSVHLAERIGAWLRQRGIGTTVAHRDIARPEPQRAPREPV
ncbi:MAG: RNase adapter RapZ [Alphaproteobacteria bacterium]